jgi:hypothetical protein
MSSFVINSLHKKLILKLMIVLINHKKLVKKALLKLLDLNPIFKINLI